jgi:thiol:disulfide interchange protein DsbD
MKPSLKYLFGLLCLIGLLPRQANAQLEQHARWEVKAQVSSAKAGEEIDIIFTAIIDKDWYLYSSDFDPDLGPTVTTFEFKKHPSYELVGGIRAINPQKKYDEIFEGDVTFFKKKAEFRQKIKLLKAPLLLEGEIDYQTCSDISGLCTQGNYNIRFSGVEIIASNGSDTESKGKEKVQNTEENKDSQMAKALQNDSIATKTIPLEEERALPEEQGTANANGGLWAFLGIAFVGGLLALLTPCVYPMIPMTVSLFMKGDKPAPPDESTEDRQARERTNRRKGIMKAMVYGISIITIYGFIGLVASLAFGIEFSNDLSTHWLPNILFFLIFLIFGMSFLGMFELVLPSSFVNRIDRKADQGGYAGVFFMAFTLVLVSFSCTAPIAGSLIFASVQGEVIRPVLGMVAFSSAFALPFVGFALFPTAMKGLPKSGGWLNTVKVFLGFVELALAFKFLSTADLAYHWGLLDRDVFLVFWIVIFALLGFYLLGKIQLPHDSKIEKLSVPRLMVAITVFSFTLYMIPGLFGANLKLLAGIIPPQSTHNFDVPALAASQGFQAASANTQLASEKVKYADFLHLPHRLQGFFDYEQGLAYAKKVNKPIFLDFTGHGCANCRKMEEYVWSDPRILRVLNEEYVIISLYVDDKTPLPEAEWYASKTGGIKKTLGKKNLHLQADLFESIAQPYYVLMDAQGNRLVKSEMGYDPDKDKFLSFLERGVTTFKQQQPAKTVAAVKP